MIEKKQRFLKVIQIHLEEVKSVTQIFDQFKQVIEFTLSNKVDSFTKRTVKTSQALDDFDAHLSELNYYL